ncbi:MAG: hypothetical protein JNL57_08345 [Bacteroidetes bacterium]|nr:hypothetical protein [Bacteroidota bacterium]
MNNYSFIVHWYVRLREFICLFIIVIYYPLQAQTISKILIEPYSGFSWSKCEKKDFAGSQLKYLIRKYNPAFHSGISVLIERKPWSFGFDTRVQSIHNKTIEYFTQDTFTWIYDTKLFINRVKLECRVIDRKNLFSKIQISYALPAKSGYYLRKIKRIDNAGSVETFGEYWYQRTGAFYGGLNFTVRSSNDRYRAGINFGAERLRHKGKSFGEWYNQHDRDRWYYMAGLNFTYTMGLNKRKK